MRMATATSTMGSSIHHHDLVIRPVYLPSAKSQLHPMTARTTPMMTTCPPCMMKLLTFHVKRTLQCKDVPTLWGERKLGLERNHTLSSGGSPVLQVQAPVVTRAG